MLRARKGLVGGGDCVATPLFIIKQDKSLNGMAGARCGDQGPASPGVVDGFVMYNIHGG